MMEPRGQRASERSRIAGRGGPFPTRSRSSVWSVRLDHPLCPSAPPVTSIAGLVGRLEIDEYGEPDWTAVRSFADWADQYPDAALDSIASPPMRTGSEPENSVPRQHRLAFRHEDQPIVDEP